MKTWVKYLKYPLLVIGAILWGLFVGDFSEGILAILIFVYLDVKEKKRKGM